MITDKENKSPLRESAGNGTPKAAKSETTNKLLEMRHAYFDALTEEREAGNLSDEELLYELQEITDGTTGIFTGAFGTVLSPEERKRLSGTSVNKHGFIDVCLEKAQEMPSLMPSWLTVWQFKANREAFEAAQRLLDAAQRCEKIVSDTSMTAADKAYRDALAFYKSVKDAAAAKVPGAEVIFSKLSTYFKGMGQHKKDAPTEAEVERDVRSLLHGTKEGRVVVENTKPHTTPGTRKVIDEVDE